jgi:hypothetical protein
MARARLFWLHRKEDISGVSGTGVVAEGVQFHDGQCVLSWFGQLHSINVYPDIATLIGVHGHGGSTEVIWDSVVEIETLTETVN